MKISQFLQRKLTKAGVISNWLNCLRTTSNGLFFCQGLISPKDAEVRKRVLNKLESEPNLTL